jgi:hypothetical protein
MKGKNSGLKNNLAVAGDIQSFLPYTMAGQDVTVRASKPPPKRKAQIQDDSIMGVRILLCSLE